jgi:hypothetical protein
MFLKLLLNLVSDIIIRNFMDTYTITTSTPEPSSLPVNLMLDVSGISSPDKEGGKI